MVIDWNAERFVTAVQLVDMPGWQRDWFERQPNIWRPHPDHQVDVLVNMAHPDNVALAVRDLIAEALA